MSQGNRVWLTAFLVAFGSNRALAIDPPTYHKDIAPLLQKHCQDCHRPGQVAPFSLLSFEQAKKRGADLSLVTSQRTMPPWHASTTEGGPFQDARVLSATEIATIAEWADAGCPEGDLKDSPAPRDFKSEWELGEPDLVLKSSEPFTLGATGTDEFRVFVLPTGLTEGRWISAVDFRPGNARVVHHVIAGIDTAGRGRRLDSVDDLPGYATFAGFGEIAPGIPLLPSGGLSGWAPGKSATRQPEGVGRWLPAGSDVLLQVHYHKSGKVETDTTSIGLYFAKTPIQKQVRPGAVFPDRPGRFARPDLKIPAGDPNYEINGKLVMSSDVHLTAVVPHMHWLGKDFLLTAEFPDGTKRTLIRIDRWDFNWQDTYDLAEPIALPSGTKILMKAHFDNSAANPANPSKPPVEVRWGEQTTNEMCIGFLQMTSDREHLEGKPPGRSMSPGGLLRGR